ncbi:hypothetical protein ACFSC6_10670 [Rufibacter sediminis]|uniref:Uncharacterized protein n=1 Tax=Rufibacter sediminis TaxID=2762756 RepID=A0ABR6VP72_9BACT|nr:hypothetical protein [Rufibacter sediminis]MBC3538997.1 hypothetical protein [Rufibacter sediminis]
MRRNENQFLLLGLLLREAKEYQSGEASRGRLVGLLDQVRKTISTIHFDTHHGETALLVSGVLESLSVAEGLAHQGKDAQAFTVTRFALGNLLAKEALFQKP